MKDIMKLPDSKTCGDCRNINKCKALFSCRDSYTSCDFYPIRYVEKSASNNEHPLQPNKE